MLSITELCRELRRNETPAERFYGNSFETGDFFTVSSWDNIRSVFKIYLAEIYTTSQIFIATRQNW